MKADIVRVDWIDSCAFGTSWQLVEDFKEDTEPIKITSVGVIVKENDEYLTIAQNYGVNPKQFCSLMSIPKGCIKNQRVIDSFEVEIKD
jgi:hypothetical protein